MTADDGQRGEQIELLLVEPNPGDTRLFTESFRDGKLVNRLHTVTDAESALAFLERRGEYADAPRPDLLLLEPKLPGKSGMELLAELEDEPTLSEIPVVVLTSSEIGEEIVRNCELEADHYLQKPIEAGEFIEFVQSIEEFWLAIVQEPGS
jgi:CheY-like chemotaxis protein